MKILRTPYCKIPLDGWCWSATFIEAAMKRNITLVTLISKKAKARIVNTLFKVNFCLLWSNSFQFHYSRTFSTHFWGDFQSNCSSELLPHCKKNEVFHQGFLQQMWPNPQQTADLITGKPSFLCTGSSIY